MTDLTELKRLEQAATSGPWIVSRDERKWVDTLGPCAENGWADNRDNDAAFIVAARNSILSLIERAERAEAPDRVGIILAINEIRWAIGDNGRAMLADLPNVVRAEIVSAEKRGYLRGLEDAAKVAEGPVADVDHKSGEARYRGDINAHHWEPPRPIAGYSGSEHGRGRADAAQAIRAAFCRAMAEIKGERA